MNIGVFWIHKDIRSRLIWSNITLLKQLTHISLLCDLREPLGSIRENRKTLTFNLADLL